MSGSDALLNTCLFSVQWEEYALRCLRELGMNPVLLLQALFASPHGEITKPTP